MLILAAFIAALLGSIAQTVVGFGVALLIGPTMFLLLDEPAEAVVSTLIASSLLSVLMLVRERDRVDLDRGVLTGLVAGILPGVVIGGLMVSSVDKAPLQVLVGIVAIAAVVTQQSGRDETVERPPLRYGPLTVPVGMTAGTLNAAVSTGGPPLAIWLRSTAAGIDQMRHTLAVCFLVMNATAIISVLIFAGVSPDEEFSLDLLGATAGIPVGYVIGRRLLDRIDAAAFGRLVVAMITVVALVSLGSGIVGL